MVDINVFFWFDVEDYITPESDEALKGILNIFEAHRVKGTFKIVGEKLRALKRRDRRDIINALRHQDIGYHTDFHSVHPTPAEYLKDLDWHQGAKEFERRERAGFEELLDTFKRVSCYGQPGSSWAPHVYPVLQSWGLPVYLDYARHICLNDEPFWYCGVMNILNLKSNSTRFEHHLGERGLSEAKEEFDAIRGRLMDAGGGEISICYHPCEFATYEFWDAVNFAKGANPDRSRWVPPRVKPRVVMEKELALLSNYVEHIASKPNVRCVTAKEAHEIYRDPTLDRSYRVEDILALADAIRPDITYIKCDKGYLTPAEVFYLIISLLKTAYRYGKECNRFSVESVSNFEVRITHPIYGAIERSASQPVPCSIGEFLAACEEACVFMESEWRLPNSVRAGDESWTPEEFLLAMSAVLKSLSRGGNTFAPTESVSTEGLIRPREATLQLERHVTDAGVWDWVIFPENFTAPSIVELARLQTWSLKPPR